MYSRAEAQQIKQEFWTTFGRWSAKKRKHQHLRERWLLNKSGINGLRFRFSAEGKEVGVHLDFIEKVPEKQESLLTKIQYLMPEIEKCCGQELCFHSEIDANTPPTISWVKSPLTIMNKEQWPQIFEFFYSTMSNLEQVIESNREFLSD